MDLSRGQVEHPRVGKAAEHARCRGGYGAALVALLPAPDVGRFARAEVHCDAGVIDHVAHDGGMLDLFSVRALEDVVGHRGFGRLPKLLARRRKDFAC